ncbi:MAG: hypothetical protein C5B50_21715 [Verrucomicrobia bacterium]|nr:MAG: hypothetical protein C5B50_21715 [Verrucomicrobiota bacterium]
MHPNPSLQRRLDNPPLGSLRSYAGARFTFHASRFTFHVLRFTLLLLLSCLCARPAAAQVAPRARLTHAKPQSAPPARFTSSTSSLSSQASVTSRTKAPGPAWIPLGPTALAGVWGSLPVSGRTTAIAVNPNNSSIVYAGAAQGGVYRSLDGGNTWVPIFDSAKSLAIGAIAIAPSSPSTVFVGTGEGNQSGDCFFGVGVYVILNADTSPTLVGPINLDANGNDVMSGMSITKILVSPSDPNTIFVTTLYGYGGLDNFDLPAVLKPPGLYRCSNALSAAPTFTQIAVAGNVPAYDMVFDPGDANNMLVALSGGVYRSVNALGATPTFTQTITASAGIRINLAITSSGGTVTAVAAGDVNGGTLLKSTDGGQTWPTTLTAATGFADGQGFYDMVVGMPPGDANTLYVGGSANYSGNGPSYQLLKSVNGGTSFQNIGDVLHPDSHTMAFDPSSPSTIYFGNDGGIYKSTDAGSTWISLNNSTYSAMQFQSLALHPSDRTFMIGGTQDNGTQWLKPDGTWVNADFGDGGYCAIDQSAPDTVNVTMYHTYAGGYSFARVMTTANASPGNWEVLGCGGTPNGISCFDSASLFYPPMALGPGTPNSFYFATDRIYRSIDRGTTMTPASQAFSFGLPVSAIGISAQDDNYRIVGLQNGQVFATTAGSATMTDVTGPIPPYFVARAKIDPTDPTTAYVCLGGFGLPAGQHIWKTSNLGSPSWVAAGKGIPDVPVNCLVIDPRGSSYLYAGTDAGVYASTDGGFSWNPYGTGMPRVAVFDIDIQPVFGILRAATHGRGIWETATALTSSLSVLTGYVTGGNGNGIVDVNECNNFYLVLANSGQATASGVHVSISTTTPEVGIGLASASYPNVPAHSTATNSTPFTIDTSSAFICGTPIVLNILIKTDSGSSTNSLTLQTGVLAATNRYDNNNFYPIPPANPVGVSAPIVVSGIPSTIQKVTVSLNIAENYDGDLTLQLVSPGGLTNTLSANHGGAGVDYGVGCGDSQRLIFDDNAVNSIGAGFPPFVGPYQPDQPLSVFKGTSGTNVNGAWVLRVVDSQGLGSGTLNCWSLFLTPATCTDGGGECQSADMTLGISAFPAPVTVGNNLTYTITVTNNGPSSVRGATVSQLLPNGVSFVSASSSQGSVAYSSGIISASLGHMSVRSTATITVIVSPLLTGTITSTATASSELSDPVPSNNSASVSTVVIPTSADVAIGLFAPAAVQVSSNLTYTLSVTNNGPSAATGVTVTNVLPSSVINISAAMSQGGPAQVLGNVVICPFNSLTPGAIATASIQCTPTVEGTITATASGGANQPDAVPANNTSSASTVVGPAADVAVSLVAGPNPVVSGGQFTFKIVVTNQGPSVAHSVALNGALPPGLTLVSNYFTLDSLSVSNNTISGTIATMPKAASALAILTFVASVPVGTNTATVSVAALEPDPVLSNNSASVALAVAPPFVSIIPAGASMLAESGPTNGAIDIGETVTLVLRLANVGNVHNTNLVATLLGTNGVVTNSIQTQTYGVLGASGPSVGRAFTFTATGTYGGSVSPTLRLVDNGVFLTNVSFTFALPNLYTFSNTNRIDIPTTAQDQNQPGPAAPYPSSITVSGVSGTVSKATVTFSNLYHTFPHDINSVVIGPTGLKSLVMSHVADESTMASPLDLIFDDTAPSPLPASGDISAGLWQPSGYNPAPTFASPAPAGPYGTALSLFNGVDPTGVWKLFANDDATGDFGYIARGWSLALTTVSPINQVADIAVSVTSSPASVRVGDTVTYTFTITNAGPAPAGGVTFTNIVPAAASLVSVTPSQGSAVSSGGLAAATLGTLNVGVVATVTVVVVPTVVGSFTNTGTVSGNQLDLSPADNSASVVTTVAASYADLGVTIVGPTNNVIVGSNFLYTVSVTNNGPNSAVGVTILLTNPVPGALTNLSCSLPSGTWSSQAGSLSGALGNLASGATRTIYVTNTALAAAQVTSTVSVSSAGSSDTNLVNNFASVTNTIAAPAPVILAAGQAIITESISPANGAVDPGETVSVSLILTNAGLLPASNLTGTLQASGGVTLPAGSVFAASYGTLANGGAAKSATFKFTAANPIPGGAVLATLQLTSGAQYLGSVGFVFNAPVSASFANTNAIIIPDHGPGIPYASTINVSGMTGIVSKVTVALNGLAHSFPSDVNVLLVNPSGGAALIQSAAGAGFSISNVDVTFDDLAAGSLPQNAQINSGTFKPTAFGGPAFPSPAPHPPYNSVLSALNGGGPNGVWSLYVLDNVAGDSGFVAQGWTLTVTTVQASGPFMDLAATISGSPASLFTYQMLTYNITVTNKGSASATGVTLTDPLPAGFIFSSASSSQGSASVNSGTVTFNLGTLASGASASASIHVQPTVSGVYANSVTASGNETDLNFANNTAQTSTSVLDPAANVLTIHRAKPQFQLTIFGQVGLSYSLLSTTNIRSSSWTTLLTAVATNGFIQYTTTDATNAPARFYRSVRITP